MTRADRKLLALKGILGEAGSVLVALSGGLDSSLLAAAAHDVLGDQAAALTVDTPAVPRRDLEAARGAAARFGFRHVVVPDDPTRDPAYASNPADRCYHCKKALFQVCRRVASELGFAVVADGTTTDDLHDYRPGLRAAREAGVRNPLVEAGISKEDVRVLAREVYGMRDWDRPPSPCLASRFPYGTPVTDAALAQVEAVETAVLDLGASDVRARYYGDTVRVEVPGRDMALMLGTDARRRVVRAAREAGFKHAVLDLEPLRSGRLNDDLDPLKRSGHG